MTDGEFLSVIKKTKRAPDGGRQPELSQVVVFPGTVREQRVSTKRTPVRVGDLVTLLTAGGGGYGDPAGRDPAAVRHDVQEGYVSEERRARKVYGVIG
ncbi:hypothetical protein [Actinoplanes sp. NPDC026619]|uniref:hypothetical protein n=1 Tax=Actinoplanes sp. NPDC026619 TaxID=3155798 RepID=UPI0034037A13